MINDNYVDFIVKNDDQFMAYLKKNPCITVSPTLTGNFKIAYTGKEEMEQIRREMGRSFIASDAEILGLLDVGDLGATDLQNYNPTELGGKGVIFGIVDTGIDYLNDVFRYQNGTSRILSIYDQTREGNAPPGFCIGTEYDQKMINKALTAEDPYQVVPSFDDVGHGTFLASVAAGRKEKDFFGVAYDAELVVVKLRGARPYYRQEYLVPPEQENAFQSTDVMLGVEYIVRKSLELGRPAVICIGLGSNFGGHDGYSLFEQYLSEVGRIEGICICVASGNECLSRHHFYGFIPESGGHQDVSLWVGEGSGNVYLTMWSSAPDLLSVSLLSPNGGTVNEIALKTGTVFQTKLMTEKSIVMIEYDYPVYGSGSQNTVIKILNASPGHWVITVHGEYIKKGKFHIWLPITGFVSPNVEFVMPSKNYTITIPGTCRGLITCRAYNSVDQSPCLYSSWGPTRTNSASPDIVAPGVNIRGIYPDGVGIMDGSGIATAILAGSCMLLMQWGWLKNDALINTYQVMGALIQGAIRFPEIEYPNDQWGYGILDLLNTLERI